ncbi:M28 family peptidase [Paenimyroides tangerinum]|uniref:M28 family peptidase n=1 Tax=Paenimyroides tangerinum TaxID=2488728 RepID=A0A3P3VY02_9FLAO|nr:M28 family peptidase [Paenimyroides tangerinum]RRJ87681.1 M28 family peptidase [Paenimyroides tangerinum]
MKKISLLILVALAGFYSFAQTNQSYQIKEENIIETLKYLTSDELEGRDSGSKGIELAANYLENQFIESGIKTYFKTYKDTLSNFEPAAYNVLGLIEGNDPKLKNEFVIIGAHYDHIGRIAAVDGDDIANGANDNASGTTMVSEVAKYFAKTKSNKRSILVVYFSAEEKGLLGAYSLAEKLKKENFNLYLMLNFEMLGVPMDKDYEVFITGFKKSNMAIKMNEYAGSNFVGYLPQEFQYRLFNASDNYPIYEKFNVPSQTICTFDFDNFKYYHHVKDEFELMDTKHMTELSNKLLPIVTKMVNAPTQEIKLNE